jgi:glycosyltransferase involved in cell wall biosynthesis
MPKVSVIVPAYNVEKYISKCLESILNQTLRDFELIVTDDCSADGTMNILKAYAEKDERIKIIQNEVNFGAAVTRNIGMDAASGEYIYFIDSDDWIDNDYLENMVLMIEKAETDIVLNVNIEVNGAKYVHPSMGLVAEQGEFIDKKRVIEDAPVFVWARLYRKKFLDKHHLRYIDIKKANDNTFHYITQIYTDRIFVFYGPTYHYLCRKDSITDTGKQEDDRDLWIMLSHEKAFDYFMQNNIEVGNIKLFQVLPFFKVNTPEKFALYKNFFNKIKLKMDKTENIYNELELFFADSILNSDTFEDYKNKYGPSVTMNYIKRKKLNNV